MPEEWGSTRPYHIALALANHGYEVDIIAGKKQETATQISIHDNVTVHYLPDYYSQNLGKVQRITTFFKFFNAAKKYVSGLKKADIIYASSTPLSIGWLGHQLSRKYKIPYIFEVRDLWPEVPLALGYLTKNKLITRLIEYRTQKIYEKASAVVVASTGMLQYLECYGVLEKTTVVTNFSDESLFESIVRVQPSTINVVYFGHLGKANHLEYLLLAAEACKRKQIEVKFHLVGEGSELTCLQRMTKALMIEDVVEFHKPISKTHLAEFLSDMHLSYVSFRHIPILFSSSPNKFFDSLLSGLPVITNTRGWMYKLLEKYHCGWYANPLIPEDFAKVLEQLKENKNYKEYSLNAIELAKKEFTTQHQTQKVVDLVNKTLQKV
jgi:glycosyltransferase involved in cell wall biosynthesis